MADRRGVIVPLIILGFIFFSPDPARRPTSLAQVQALPSLEQFVAAEQYALAVLQNSTYQSLEPGTSILPDLNLTGLEPDRGYAWDALSHVQMRAGEQMRYALPDYASAAVQGALRPEVVQLYNNVTGYVQGTWLRSTITKDLRAPQLNLSAYVPAGPFGRLAARPFERNVTGEHGDIRIRLHEKLASTEQGLDLGRANATKIKAELTVQDSSTSEEWEVNLHGVYFVDFGQAILTTTSDKFAGFVLLPHLALSNYTFELSKTVVNNSISSTIERQLAGSVGHDPWASKPESANASPYAFPQCELIVYLQQIAPLGGTSQSPSRTLSFLEHELRFPTGAFIPPVGKMRFDVVVFSPDCGYVLETQAPHLTGPKVEVLYRNGRHHLLLFTIILGLQLLLLMRQMREASTPSTRSRISFYTLALLSLGDGFGTMVLLLVSLFISALWVNFIAAAFVAFIGVSFFSMHFMMDIWAVQAPERARRAREEAEEERQRIIQMTAALERVRAERIEREAVVSAAPTGNGELARTTETPAALTTQPILPTLPILDTLPPPVTAVQPTDTGATPVFMPSDQEGLQPITQPLGTAQPPIDNEPVPTSFGSMYARFYLLLLAVLFTSLSAASWPSLARRAYFTLIALLYLSFWLPQIIRNIQRNCRRALSWDFVLGQSALRLVPFFYFYTYPNNVLFAEVDWTSFSLLAGWVWVQVVLLASQELIGPRWFIRQDWAPPAYDYHPVLRTDEEGSTLPLGLSQTPQSSEPSSPALERSRSSLSAPPDYSLNKDSTRAAQRGKRVFDCAICMQDLEVTVTEPREDGSSSSSGREVGLGGGAGLLARRHYMVTPCRHIFHSPCLEGWMKYRLQCPICRETLPPL